MVIQRLFDLFYLEVVIRMKSVVAEKPSVGAAPAKALGAREKKKGYIEGDDLIVSWYVGHLVELANADIYDEHYGFSVDKS